MKHGKEKAAQSMTRRLFCFPPAVWGSEMGKANGVRAYAAQGKNIISARRRNPRPIRPVTGARALFQGTEIHFAHLELCVYDMKILCGLIVMASLLAGCAVYTPDGAVIVDPHRGGGGGGGFCPPGQAKKGNC
ncbi:hypothetical protein KDH83_19455 [Achromobacter sp. Marseille-Q0513]|uniref:hypothetical protein n=1 Tax=Achromobacter sp. Marseille-Q0513 TaxID=2829161 RepID=UPI001BA37B2F|nr:hypothetical protein [Achromobacter sp. Marseille-Q0513]MBR8655482.1 hypothetical protein [Achromobacter sp. Marseille-Q0513]